MFGLKRRKVNQNSREAYQIQRKLGIVNVSQERVLRTIAEIQPCHYRQISEKLHIIEGSVTPRIAELHRSKLIRVSENGKGSSGRKVAYYVLTNKGFKRLREISL